MSYYIAVNVSPREMKHFEVPGEVYIYIKQLELALRFGDQVAESLSKVYPGRFSFSGRKEPFDAYLQTSEY